MRLLAILTALLCVAPLFAQAPVVKDTLDRDMSSMDRDRESASVDRDDANIDQRRAIYDDYRRQEIALRHELGIQPGANIFSLAPELQDMYRMRLQALRQDRNQRLMALNSSFGVTGSAPLAAPVVPRRSEVKSVTPDMPIVEQRNLPARDTEVEVEDGGRKIEIEQNGRETEIKRSDGVVEVEHEKD